MADIKYYAMEERVDKNSVTYWLSQTRKQNAANGSRNYDNYQI